MTKQPNSAGSIALAMPRFAAVILLAAIILGSLIQAAPQALAQAKANTKRSFGDWQIDCGKPPGARAQRCALLQSVIDE